MKQIDDFYIKTSSRNKPTTSTSSTITSSTLRNTFIRTLSNTSTSSLPSISENVDSNIDSNTEEKKEPKTFLQPTPLEISISVNDLPTLSDEIVSIINSEKFYKTYIYLLFYTFSGLFAGIILNAITNYTILNGDMIFFSLGSPFFFYYSPINFIPYIFKKENKIKSILYFLGFLTGLASRFLRFYFSFVFNPKDITNTSSVVASFFTFFFLACVSFFYIFISKFRFKNGVLFLTFILLFSVCFAIYSSTGGEIYLTSLLISGVYHIFSMNNEYKIMYFFHSFFYGLMIESISKNGIERIY